MAVPDYIRGSIYLNIYIMVVLIGLYNIQSVFKDAIGRNMFFSVFLTESEFTFQIGYLTAIFVHTSGRHLFINISMICIGALIAHQYIETKYILSIIFGSAILSMIGYALVGTITNYSGVAAGISGGSFAILANSIVARARTNREIILYTTAPVLFIVFETIRFIGFESTIFVSNSPMTNIAHIIGILSGYVLIIVYILYSKK